MLFIDQPCLTNSLQQPFHIPWVSLSLLLLFSHLQNHCCHSDFSKIFIIMGVGEKQASTNKVRFLCHQNLFLIHIFLLFSMCALAKEVPCYFWSICHLYQSLCPQWLSLCLCLENSSLKAQNSLHTSNLSHFIHWKQKVTFLPSVLTALSTCLWNLSYFIIVSIHCILIPGHRLIINIS